MEKFAASTFAIIVIMPKDPFEIYTSSEPGASTPRDLSWEESAHDADSPVEGFANVGDGEDTHRSIPRWVHFVVLGCCIVLAVKLFSVQVMQGGKFQGLAEGNRLRIQTILAPRGNIVDRTGQVLAHNTASFSLTAVPVDLPKEDINRKVAELSLLLKIDENEIKDKLKGFNTRSFEPIILKQDLSQQDSILFETHASEFPGFAVASIPIREYPNPEAFSHLLGYSGIVSDTELAKLASQGYEHNDFIGKLGIESSYEKYLRGVNGQRQVQVDASGHPVKVLGDIEPQAGSVVTLNINQGLQETLYKSFMKTPNIKGAAVAMNPRTGEILALVSVPGFDNNMFAHGISSADYSNLINNKALPLFDRAVSGTYPPGSTVKPMVAAAALQEGVVNENTVIVDRGKLVIPNQFNPSVTYAFNGWKASGLGPMTVRSAIAESSDIYFYTVAGGHPSSSVVGLGAQRLADYYRKFGVGSKTGIDIQGEKPGIVPDPAWKASYYKGDPILSKWYLGDTYHEGIGQGNLLTTPLQVALWTATIANNGKAYAPTILHDVKDQKGNIIFRPEHKLLVDTKISMQAIKIVQEGMRQTVTGGTGRALNTLPITSAGKTGTSQFDGSDPTRTHAWYTSYAPYEDPQIVITVLVEAGGEGHAASAPIVKEALQWCADNNCLNK